MVNDYTRDEMMTVATSRFIRDGCSAFIGTGLPMVAAYLAKATHAPNATLMFESGVLAPEPRSIAHAVGDPRLQSTARQVSGMLNALLLLHGGNVDFGVLGGAQVDRYGNINSVAVGGDGYHRPATRLGGSGGANDIASAAGEFLIVVRHTLRTFVERVDHLTTPGFITGPGARKAAGLRGRGPVGVVTDLGVFGFNDDTKQMMTLSLHHGVQWEQVVEATGFTLGRQGPIAVTEMPTAEELHLLRNHIDPDGFYLKADQA
ncbi:MAG: CoA-transferase subunit beta [Microbacteriaceae bacterium]